MKENYNTFELKREMTQQEREEMRALFGDSATDTSAYHEERAKRSHEDTQRRGLEALLSKDKDILKTVECLDIASKNENNSGLTYAILDVDNMSEINMKYGEQVGNLILKYVREVSNYVLMNRDDKAYHVGKPSTESPQSKGDQLILILNHAYLPQEDLDNLIDIIKEGVATRVYDDLRMNFRSIPARWKDIEQEKISVTIGYATVRDAKIHNQNKRGEEKCTMAISLRDIAMNSLKIAKVQTKKKGSGTAFGLN